MTRRIVVWVVAVASIGFGTGVAFAFVSSSGHGSGAGSVTSMQSVTIDADAQDNSGALLPGTAADAAFGIDNPNSAAVTVTSVVQNGSISVSGAPGCTLANSGVTFTNQTGLTVTIPASSNDYLVELPTAMSMSSTAANSCQNATFNVPITITVHQ